MDATDDGINYTKKHQGTYIIEGLIQCLKQNLRAKVQCMHLYLPFRIQKLYAAKYTSTFVTNPKEIKEPCNEASNLPKHLRWWTHEDV